MFFLKPLTSSTNLLAIRRCCSINQLGKVYGLLGEEERSLYLEWESSGQFEYVSSCPGDKFSLLLPPPNVTGQLHLGHALTVSCQDALARWMRMRGRGVCWVPGVDHAGLATQVMVERVLASQDRPRHLLDREQFLSAASHYTRRNQSAIIAQLQALAASLDWSRHYYTLDPERSLAVREGFVQLWERGLVYRSSTLVNWCCSLGTAISDIELVHREVSGPTEIPVPGYHSPVTFGLLYNIAFKLHNQPGELVVGTTRPETMPGDVCLCVHPRDPRHSHLVGARVLHPLTGALIPVLADSSVDPTFSTGVLKVTPAHDATDLQIAKRLDLPVISVIDEKGLMTSSAGKYQGMRRFDARESIVKELSEKGAVRAVEDHTMTVPLCSRTSDVIELLVTPQWFLKCGEMAERSIDLVRSGRLKITPSAYEDTWFNWLSNIRDWCLSRQVWWGHRVPVWSGVAARSEAEAALLLGPDTPLVQDPDVLDTWFSSALLPLSALGWPRKESEGMKLLPLDVMVTGHDILFFWVARMTMLGVELTGRPPFKEVFLHGIVCDSQGRKMSKSLGNVINPQDVINGLSLQEVLGGINERLRQGVLSPEEAERSTTNAATLFPDGIPACGTDALRLALLSYNVKDQVISFDIKDVVKKRSFCNKAWQAVKFTVGWCKRLGVEGLGPVEEPDSVAKWVLVRLYATVDSVNNALPNYDFAVGITAIIDFLHKDFCDIYIEHAKLVLQGGDQATGRQVCQVLLSCLEQSFRLLAPLTPYLADVLYRALTGTSVHSTSYPTQPSPVAPEWRPSESLVSHIIDVVREIRKVKSTHPSIIKVGLLSDEKLDEFLPLLQSLTKTDVFVVDGIPQDSNLKIHSVIGGRTRVFLKFDGGSALSSQERDKRAEKLSRELDKLVRTTSHPSYGLKVKPSVQQTHLEKIEKLKTELAFLRGAEVDDEMTHSSQTS